MLPSRRWIVLGLVAFATTINYVDRQTLSVLGPTLRNELHLTDAGYANIVTAFLVPYTVMYALGGRIMDRIGARLGLALSFAWWSVATMLTGLARGPWSLGMFRALLGIGEPCVFPAGMKTCAEFFEPERRALAAGIFSAGSSVGALIAPPLVAWISIRHGWRSAFLIPGLLGLFWLPLWLLAYPRKREHTESDQAAPRPAWRDLLRDRRVWSLVLPRMASDPVWYFYLFWLPDYLQRSRHLSLQEFAAMGWIPFLFADLGSITGGAASDWLVRRGVEPWRARVRVLIGVACLAPLGALVGVAPTLVTAVAVTCLVAFLTQVWAANTVTLASDLLPQNATGTAVGMMGTAGSLGGAIFAQLLGLLVSRAGYPSAFALAALLHPLAITILLFGLSGNSGQHPATLRFRG